MQLLLTSQSGGLKFLWALVHKTADNSPRWLDKDEAMEDLKMRARFARFVVEDDGKVELRPKSLKRINDEALRLLTDKIMDIICQEILPGMKKERPPQGDRVDADGKPKGGSYMATEADPWLLQGWTTCPSGKLQINIPYGVWSSLVDRGFLRHHPMGWEITPEGRAKMSTDGQRDDTRPDRVPAHAGTGRAPRER